MPSSGFWAMYPLSTRFPQHKPKEREVPIYARRMRSFSEASTLEFLEPGFRDLREAALAEERIEGLLRTFVTPFRVRVKVSPRVDVLPAVVLQIRHVRFQEAGEPSFMYFGATDVEDFCATRLLDAPVLSQMLTTVHHVGHPPDFASPIQSPLSPSWRSRISFCYPFYV